MDKPDSYLTVDRFLPRVTRITIDHLVSAGVLDETTAIGMFGGDTLLRSLEKPQWWDASTDEERKNYSAWHEGYKQRAHELATLKIRIVQLNPDSVKKLRGIEVPEYLKVILGENYERAVSYNKELDERVLEEPTGANLLNRVIQQPSIHDKLFRRDDTETADEIFARATKPKSWEDRINKWFALEGIGAFFYERYKSGERLDEEDLAYLRLQIDNILLPMIRFREDINAGDSYRAEVELIRDNLDIIFKAYTSGYKRAEEFREKYKSLIEFAQRLDFPPVIAK